MCSKARRYCCKRVYRGIFERVLKQFTEPEIVELTMAICTIKM
jgi:hypothetical protein